MRSHNLNKAFHQFFWEAQPHTVSPFGRSMAPLITEGETIRIVPCPARLRIGRCYVFSSDGVMLLHRLVFVTRRSAFFAGDNNTRIERVGRQDIVGEAVMDYRPIGVLMVTLCNWFFCILHKVHGPWRKASALRNRWISFWLKGGFVYEGTVCKA
jgi:hypothetical protein